MMKARIFQPDKNAMQSGKGKSRKWKLEFAPETAMPIDGLMGWTGMNDTNREIRLTFPTKEAAIAYATKQHIEFEVFEPNPRTQNHKAYADNFAFTKIKA